MKHIQIKLNKDEVTQLKRGGTLDYYYSVARIEIIGPVKEPRKTAKMNPKGHGSI